MTLDHMKSRLRRFIALALYATAFVLTLLIVAIDGSPVIDWVVAIVDWIALAHAFFNRFNE